MQLLSRKLVHDCIEVHRAVLTNISPMCHAYGNGANRHDGGRRIRGPKRGRTPTRRPGRTPNSKLRTITTENQSETEGVTLSSTTRKQSSGRAHRPLLPHTQSAENPHDDRPRGALGVYYGGRASPEGAVDDGEGSKKRSPSYIETR